MARRDARGGDAPLLEWGDALRARKLRRRQLRCRITIVATGLGLISATIAFPPSPRLVWNASASAPMGLYAVTLGARIKPGDMVIAWTPRGFRWLAAVRHYIPTNVPLVKRVAARAGDEICAPGAQVFINGSPSAVRREVDGHGRKMPIWSGCQRLHEGEYLLLNDDPASFDGRYFGPTDDEDVIGKARLLWRW